MEFLMGTPATLKPALMNDMARYRHKVFIEKLGWQLKCTGALEYDQFDRDDTVYVAAVKNSNEVIGTARLLPTTRPYLLGEVFPQLMGGLPVPASEDIWELSRFAAADLSSGPMRPLGQFSSPIAVGLLRAAIATAAANGAKQLVTVSPVGIERLLRKAGFEAHRAAPPLIIDGHPVFACFIPVHTA